MDLDNIKKTWQQTDIRPDIDDDKIRKMLSNEGHSAFNSLLKYERFGIIMLIICLPIGYLVFGKYMPVAVSYIISVLLGILWQLYKYRKLKKVDMAQHSITEISNQVYRYRKIIYKEFIVGLVWFIAFVLFLGYWEFSDEGIPSFIYIIAMAIAFVAVIFTYKKLYWNNIKKLEAAIKEVEEFEENEE
jgi:hypothetical protein